MTVTIAFVTAVLPTETTMVEELLRYAREHGWSIYSRDGKHGGLNVALVPAHHLKSPANGEARPRCGGG